jgi:pyruvate/2-oxoglutarate/acetoin dehydrogenase E1 component
MSAVERTLIEAINLTLHEEMERDESVIVLGEDVGVLGGVFRATVGLQERFGAMRCVDTPLAEAGIVGTAIGLVLAGWRPVCEIQFDGFCYPALDQVIAHVSRYRWRTRGRCEFPIVIRIPCGGGVGAPEHHEDSPEAYFAHTPGLKVVMPATPADAKGLLAAAIRDPDPVVVFEPKRLYRQARADVPDGEYLVPLGLARLARQGDDVTFVSYGAMVPVAEEAADTLADGGISADVLDLRTLTPLDCDAILASVRSTGRVVIVHEAQRTAGLGAEIAAVIAEGAIDHLRGPILRVTGYDTPVPYPCLSDAYRPSVQRVVAAAERILAVG